MHFILLPIVMEFGYDAELEDGPPMYVRGFLTRLQRDAFLQSVAPNYAHLHLDLQPRAVSLEEAQQYAARHKCVWAKDDIRGLDLFEAPFFDVLPSDFSIDSEEDCLTSVQKYPWLTHLVPSEYQARDMQLAICPHIGAHLFILFFIDKPIAELQQAFLAWLGDGTGAEGKACLSILLTEHEKFYTHLIDAVKPGLNMALQLTKDDAPDVRRAAIVDFLQDTPAKPMALPQTLILNAHCE